MPRVYTKIVLDMATSEVLESESYEYSGDLALCKGADTANAQRQQELAMQQQAFNTQMQQLTQLQSQLSPYTTGQGQGFTPEQYASMQSQFLNNNAAQFQNAGQAVRQALLARGGGMGNAPVSGDYTRGISSLMGAAASSQAQGLLGLQQQNAMQALQNRFNALGLETGGAQILTGAQGVAGSGASSALQSFIQAKNTGLMQSLMSGLGQGLGSGLGAGVGGGIGNVLSGLGRGGGSVMNLGMPTYMSGLSPITAPTGSSGVLGTVPG